MDVGRVIEGLHPLERRVLQAFQKHPAEEKDVKAVMEEAGILEVEAIRAFDWLSRKGLLVQEKTVRDIILLDENGISYKESGLPERRFLMAILKASRTLDEIRQAAGLDDDEVRSSLGTLKGKLAITFEGGKAAITQQGKILLEKSIPEEAFLKKTFPLPLDALSSEDRSTFDSLKRRKRIIRQDRATAIKARLTPEGGALITHKLEGGFIDQLTPELLQTGGWKGKKFRRYNITMPSPRFHGGRAHPLQVIIDDMRQIWLEMGFVEIAGPWVETAFWCMDSMWIPQDHPARDIQDTFYLPYEGDIPDGLAKKVAVVHENGGKSGSKGYGQAWDPKAARQLLLRTHTTAATFREFGKGRTRPPLKCFSVGRIFRNETIDATHLPEFHQIEGFVMDDGLTICDLMGYISEFYKRMGITKIKFRPTYNPYTEPSMEALGYSEELGKWVELINSGMFRPEALEPYGITTPVIAWGLGVERLAMMVYGEKTIKNLLGAAADISWLWQYKMPIRGKTHGHARG